MIGEMVVSAASIKIVESALEKIGKRLYKQKKV